MPANRVTSLTPWHAVFVLDDSGSMKGEKVRSLNSAMKDMVGEMRMTSGGTKPYFRVSIVRFGSNADILAEAKSECDIDPGGVFRLSGNSGTTNAAEALDKAREVLERHPGESSHFEPFVFFFSDGYPDSEGRAIEAGRWLKDLRLASGEVRLITVGIGNVNDHFMKELSMRHGEPLYRKLHTHQDIETFFPVIGTVPIARGHSAHSAADRLAGGIVTI